MATAPKCPKCKKPLEGIYEYVMVRNYIPIDSNGEILWDEAIKDFEEGLDFSLRCEHCGYGEVSGDGGILDEIV